MFEIDQLSERHAQNRIRLNRRQRISFFHAARLREGLETVVPQATLQERGGTLDLHQATFGGRLIRRGADRANDFVDIGVRDQETFNQVLPTNRLIEQEIRTSANHRSTMTQEFDDQFFEIHHARTTVDEREKDDREGIL